MATYIRNMNATLFADLTPEQTTEVTYRIQQYAGEAPLDKLATTGLSSDYVMRETKRAVACRSEVAHARLVQMSQHLQVGVGHACGVCELAVSIFDDDRIDQGIRRPRGRQRHRQREDGCHAGKRDGARGKPASVL